MATVDPDQDWRRRRSNAWWKAIFSSRQWILFCHRPEENPEFAANEVREGSDSNLTRDLYLCSCSTIACFHLVAARTPKAVVPNRLANINLRSCVPYPTVENLLDAL